MEIYHIHNTVRRVGTRLKRQQAAGRHRFQQNLAGGQIIIRRNRYAAVTADRLAVLLTEVKAKVEAGTLEVRTRGGQVVDLSTMKAAMAPSAKALPAKKVDAGVAEDKPQGPPLMEQGSAPVEGTGTELPEGHASGTDADGEAIEVKGGADPVAARRSKRKSKKGKGSDG